MKKIQLIFSAALLGILCGCSSTGETSKVSPDTARMTLAIKYANEYNLRTLLQDGADPNSCDANGVPFLLKTAILKNPACLKLMLQHGANPNLADREGFTALHCAAGAGNEESVQALLKAGAKVDARTNRGRTPLMEAVRMGKLPAAELLYKNGADLHAADSDKGTVATHASVAPAGGLQVLKFMYEKKVPFAVPGMSLQNSPLLRSFFLEKLENAHFILSTIPSFKEDEIQGIGQVAMRLAIRANDLEGVKMLYKKGVSLNLTTPLAFQAVQIVNMDGIYKLMARSDIVDRGYTPLIWAAIYARPEIAAWLIYQGANPHYRSNEGQAAIDYANDRATYRAIKNAIRQVKERPRAGEEEN